MSRGRRLRVLIAGEFAPDPSEVYGGIPAVNAGLVEGLRRIADIDLQVVTCEMNIPRDSTADFDGVPIHYRRAPDLPHTLRMLTSDPLKIRRVIRKVRPDVVHAHGTTSYAHAALGLSYPTVVTVHGIMKREAQFSYGSKWRDLVRSVLTSGLERRNLSRARRVVASSPYVFEQIRDEVTGVVHHIPNPVQQDFFNLDRSERPGLILCASRIEPRKGLMDLLVAVERVREAVPAFSVMITGVARPEWQTYFDSLRSFVKQHRLENIVTFPGHLKRSALIDALRNCQIFVLPSVEESSPMSIAQAMAAGKAVIARKIGGTSHLVMHCETGLLFESAEELAAHLRTLLCNSNLGEQYGTNGRRKAKLEFCSEVIAARMREVYDLATQHT